MITFDQALTANEFHEGACSVTVGPRGGKCYSIRTWRRSGKTQVWKTRPGEFRIPVKFGLYYSSEITHRNAADFHVAHECNLPA